MRRYMPATTRSDEAHDSPEKCPKAAPRGAWAHQAHMDFMKRKMREGMSFTKAHRLAMTKKGK